MNRILLIRLTALGDVLLATPVLRALRAAAPDAHIDWLVHGNLLPLLTENPHLTRAVPDTAGGHAKLFEARYDLVLDLQNKPRTAWLRARLRARRTLVLRKRSFGQALRAVVGQERPERGPSAVDRNLALLSGCGVSARGRELDLQVSSIGLMEVARLLPHGGTEGARQVAPLGLAPGGSWATKRWPHFAELAAVLASEGHPMLLLGGPEDGDALDRVAQAIGAARGAPPPDDTRTLSVAGLAAGIAACSSLITNDSGPAHIAAAVGTPALVLFGPTSPERWTPPGRGIRVLTRAPACSPCSNHGSARCPLGTHACLREMSVQQVLEGRAEAWPLPVVSTGAGPN